MEQFNFGPAGSQIPDAVGATAQSNGARGLVPAPSSGDQDKFLKGDGTWDSVPSPAGKVDIDQGTANTGKVMRVNASGELEPDDEQDISGKLNIAQGSANAGKFMKVGQDGNLVPDTVPLPSVMTGATSSSAGTSGLVPAPASGYQNKVLKGNGTWGDVDALPAVTASDNGKFLRVVNGSWAAATVPNASGVSF